MFVDVHTWQNHLPMPLSAPAMKHRLTMAQTHPIFCKAKLWTKTLGPSEIGGGRVGFKLSGEQTAWYWDFVSAIYFLFQGVYHLLLLTLTLWEGLRIDWHSYFFPHKIPKVDGLLTYLGSDAQPWTNGQWPGLFSNIVATTTVIKKSGWGNWWWSSEVKHFFSAMHKTLGSICKGTYTL